MTLEYEASKEMVCSEPRAKLTKDPVGHELSNDLVPRSRPRNVVAQLLGLAPLPIEQKISHKQGKDVVSSTRQLVHKETFSRYYQCQSKPDDEDVRSIVSLCGHSEEKQLHQLKKEMDESQHSKPWSTLRSLLLDADGQVVMQNMQAIKAANMKSKKTHHDSIYVSSSHRVSFTSHPNSKEIIEAMDFLQSNKDFFSKFLNDPNSLFTRRLLNTEPCSSPRGTQENKITHVVKLREEEVRQCNVIKSKKSFKTDQHTRQKPDESLPSVPQNLKGENSYGDEYLICNEQKKKLNGKAKNGAFPYPTKIVLLKPSSAKKHSQKTPSLSCPSDQASREAICNDNSEDAFDKLTTRLRKAPREAKVEATRHSNQKTPVNHKDGCKASRERAQNFARQVSNTTCKDSMQRHKHDGFTRSRNISSRSATDQVESFSSGMSSSNKLPHWDLYITSRTDRPKHEHCFGTPKKLHVKECQNTILDRSRVSKGTPSCHLEHLTSTVADEDLSKHCNQRSQPRIPPFMVVQNTVNSKVLPMNAKGFHGEREPCGNGSMEGLKDGKPDVNGGFERASQPKRTHCSPNQVYYGEKLGKFLLETNKTKVDVAVQALLTRNRRLSSSSKGCSVRQVCDQTDQATPCLDQCDENFKQKTHAVALVKTIGVDTVTKLQEPLTESSALFEKADNSVSFPAYNQDLSTSCRKNEKDGCKSTTFQTAAVELIGMVDGEIQPKSHHHHNIQACSALSDAFEYQRLPESPAKSTTTTANGKASCDQCEMLSTAFFKEYRAIDESANSVDFKEAGAKLQELRLRLQLLKAQEKRIADKKLERTKLEGVTKDRASLDRFSVQRASACHKTPEAGFEHSDVDNSQIENTSVAEDRNRVHCDNETDFVADSTLTNCDNDSPGAANSLNTADSDFRESKTAQHSDKDTLRVPDNLNPVEPDVEEDTIVVHCDSLVLTAENSLNPAESESVLKKVEHSRVDCTISADVECHVAEEMEMLYVQNILASSAFGRGGSSPVASQWHAPTQPFDSQFFLTLEDSHKGVTVEGGINDGKDLLDACSRKLLFDFVNEILPKMLGGYLKCCPPSRTFKIASCSVPTSKELLNSAWKEKQTLSCLKAFTTEQLVAEDISQWETGFEMIAHNDEVGADLATAILNDLVDEFLFGKS